jgi:glucose dehydrogenase
MADPYARTIGTVTDMDGCPVPVGVDYDAVTIGPCLTGTGIIFTQAQAEEFAQLFVSACWQAGAQSRQMCAEAAINAAEAAMDP